MRFRVICFMMLIPAIFLSCQQQIHWESPLYGGELAKIYSANSLFPHSLRAEGHTYVDNFYPAAGHYQDSTVAIYIPPGFQKAEKTDLLFYFHGWWNNIDSAMSTFRIAEQFAASSRNAIFVFPEGPRNSPDSFGGKLEEAGKFKLLVEEVIDVLKKNQKISTNRVANITLAGHSGAYRVMGKILHHGGLTNHINEVMLFDGLYGEFDSYAKWVLNDESHRFIHITTSNGGTWKNSLNFLTRLDSLHTPYLRIDGNDINDEQLNRHNIVFIFSPLGHNEVIQPFFQQFLRSSRDSYLLHKKTTLDLQK